MEQPKYYTSITTLPLYKFIECLVDKNLFALVITGEPDKEELQGAWDGILMEYNDASQGAEDKMHFNLLKEFELLKIQIMKVSMCVQVLQAEINFPEIVAPDKKYADDLNELSESNFAFDHSNPEQFREDLKRAERRSKYLMVQLGMKQASLEAINTKKNTKVTKPTREYFQSILNTLSAEVCKFQLTEAITVYSFCDWVKKFNAQQKFLIENQKKR